MLLHDHDDRFHMLLCLVFIILLSSHYVKELVSNHFLLPL